MKKILISICLISNLLYSSTILKYPKNCSSFIFKYEENIKRLKSIFELNLEVQKDYSQRALYSTLKTSIIDIKTICDITDEYNEELKENAKFIKEARKFYYNY